MANRKDSRARSGEGRASRPGGLGSEAAGIALVAFALYGAVALFYPDGAGVIGRGFGRAAFNVVGYTSYLLPFIVAVVGVELLLRRVFSFSYAVPVSFFVFILAFSALSSVVSSDSSGGAVGAFLAGYFVPYLGATGSVIVLLAVVLISVVMATGVSLVQAGVRLYPPLAALFTFIVGKARREGGEEEEGAEAAAQVEADDDEAALRAAEEEAAAAEKKREAPAIIAPAQHRARRREQRDEEDEKLDITRPRGTFKLPPLTLLDPVPEKAGAVDSNALLENSRVLEKKLQDFDIDGRVLEVRPGPVVTMYEFEPAAGVKVNRITALADDLALALRAESIRIIAPIPGKSVVGIEVPNHGKETIRFREMLESQAYAKARSRLSIALGKDISGAPYVADLARMPHLLVAGATGAGKSVSVNAMILSVLFKATPDDVRLMMVDPKMLELSAYEGIPHLITPVITDPKRAASALRAMVKEMAARYKLMAMKGARNIDAYNAALDADAGRSVVVKETAREGPEVGHRRLPYIVVIIDELADLMMTSGKEVEECLVRLSQMARAAGIHLLVATQRPSVDVVTGLIKTNFPARIAFQLPTRVDSRTILDSGGAETLLGQGDMLFLPPGTSKLMRIHGAYVSEGEIHRVTEFWKKQGAPSYGDVVIEDEEEGAAGEDEDLGEEFLKRYDEAVELASRMEMLSTSYLQRRFRIGYNTAARIIEKMEKDGIVGPAQGSRPREVLKRV